MYPSPLFEEVKELKEEAEEGGLLAESVLSLLRLLDRGLMLRSDSVLDSTPEKGKGSDCKP